MFFFISFTDHQVEKEKLTSQLNVLLKLGINEAGYVLDIDSQRFLNFVDVKHWLAISPNDDLFRENCKV